MGTTGTLIGAVVSWALLSAVTRVLLLRYELDPWGFSFVQMLVGGAVLLAMSGGASFGITSFKRSSTWVIGALRVLSAALYAAALAIVSVLEVGALGAITVPMIALATWAILRGRPARLEWIGHSIISLCVAALVWQLEIEARWTVVTLLSINAICLVALSMLSELHPDNLSDDRNVRLGFSGAVLLVNAAIFLAVRFIIQTDDDTFIDLPVLVAGTIVGITLRAPAMVLTFSAIRLSGAQGYLAAVTTLPLVGMVFEQGFVATGLIEASRFDFGTLILACGTIIGAVIVLSAKAASSRRNKQSPRDGSP